MIIELFITVQTITIITFIGAYKTRNEILWTATIINAWITAQAALTIEKITMFGQVITTTNPKLTWLNFGIAIIAFLYFFIDVFDKYRPEFIEKPMFKPLRRIGR